MLEPKEETSLNEERSKAVLLKRNIAYYKIENI